MKRTATVVLICISVLLIYSASAETTSFNDKFSIRNDICFGMTKEEILISEKEYGTNIINTFENESDPYYNPTGYSYSLGYSISNAILGYQSSNIIFYFDNEDKLMSLSYGLGVGNDSGVTASEAYDETKILLIDKYGDPYSTNKIISEDLVTTALSEDIYATELFRAFGENSYVRNVCQWLVKYCDCYVLIDLYIEKPFSDYDESCKLAYRMIPMNIGEKLENEKNTNAQKKLTDF